MELVAEPPLAYLGADDVIDVEHPAVQALSTELASRARTSVAYARASYVWVRDNIGHSLDVKDRRITITASQTLHEGVGLCFAKSHLLTALLRARRIPAGLCYQRLSDGSSHSLHGLVAVHMEGSWRRQDPRGNKAGVDAQFDLTQERLAWPVNPDLGEVDYPRIFASAHPTVLASLREADDALVLCDGRLPAQL